MELKVYQVDAFADKVFSGNPALVCPLTSWLEDSLMQQMAMEANLSETVFFASERDGYRIRWFTPAVEVDLCGHATLAAAWVIRHYLGDTRDTLVFHSRSGKLGVSFKDERVVLDFPASVPIRNEVAAFDPGWLGLAPRELWFAEDCIALFDSEQQLRALKPDFRALRDVPARGVIATAPGDDCDFVCRFFAPRCGIDEDPVTGSAYTQLAPFWAGRLGRQHFQARQLSSRGGSVKVALHGDRVAIGGRVQPYMTGTVILP